MDKHIEHLEELEGEIMEQKTGKRIPKLRTIRFARLLSEGADPMEALDKTSPIGKHTYPANAKENKANKIKNLLRECQEQGLIDVASLAPKATKKLEELLDAKKMVMTKMGVMEFPDNFAQLGAAKTILDKALPKNDKASQPSLLAGVIEYEE